MSKCIGCGIELQDVDSNQDGYVSRESLELCERCFKIKNYGRDSNTYTNNTDYLKIMDNITVDDLVVYVSSLLTLNLDYINKFKNVILVLTKRDILPKSVKNHKIINYIKNKYNNLIDIVVVSSYKKLNLDNLYNVLNKYGINKKIYIVGATNSGKSTLINAMTKSYCNNPGLITTSSFPATTLACIDVKIGNLNIIDTPGIIINDSIINYMDYKYIKKINSKKEIKPSTFQVNGSGSILLDDIIRIDYNTDNSSMTFYVSNSIKVVKASLNNPRLKDIKNVDCNVDNDKDVVIEDIGFIKVTNKSHMKLWYKDDIHISIRDNLI